MESINHTQAYYNRVKIKDKNIILKVDNKEGQFVYRGIRIQNDFLFLKKTCSHVDVGTLKLFSGRKWGKISVQDSKACDNILGNKC